MRRKGRWCCILLGMLCLVTWGCGPRAAEPMRMMAKQRPYFSDVPVPMGFSILEEASEDSGTGKRRLYARHVYEGSADLYAVKQFYIERMPQYKWQLANTVHVGGRHQMRFEKGQESCTLTIERAGSGWGSKIRVQLIIMQEERRVQSPERNRGS